MPYPVTWYLKHFTVLLKITGEKKKEKKKGFFITVFFLLNEIPYYVNW